MNDEDLTTVTKNQTAVYFDGGVKDGNVVTFYISDDAKFIYAQSTNFAVSPNLVSNKPNGYKRTNETIQLAKPINGHKVALIFEALDDESDGI